MQNLNCISVFVCIPVFVGVVCWDVSVDPPTNLSAWLVGQPAHNPATPTRTAGKISKLHVKAKDKKYQVWETKLHSVFVGVVCWDGSVDPPTNLSALVGGSTRTQSRYTNQGCRKN